MNHKHTVVVKYFKDAPGLITNSSSKTYIWYHERMQGKKSSNEAFLTFIVRSLYINSPLSASQDFKLKTNFLFGFILFFTQKWLIAFFSPLQLKIVTVVLRQLDIWMETKSKEHHFAVQVDAEQEMRTLGTWGGRHFFPSKLMQLRHLDWSVFMCVWVCLCMDMHACVPILPYSGSPLNALSPDGS